MVGSHRLVATVCAYQLMTMPCGGVGGGGGGGCGDGCGRTLTQGGISWDCGLTAQGTGQAGLIRRLSTVSWVLQVTLEGV